MTNDRCAGTRTGRQPRDGAKGMRDTMNSQLYVAYGISSTRFRPEREATERRNLGLLLAHRRRVRLGLEPAED